MLQISGAIREKLGRTVNKAMLLECVGTDEIGRPKWRVIASHFFGHNEKFWMIDNKAYELKLENECYGRGEVHVQFINAKTGDSVNMTGFGLAYKDPETLRQWVNTSHIKTFAQNVKGMGPQVLFLGVGILAGVFLGFVLGQNWNGIIGTIKGQTAQLVMLWI